MPPRSSSQEAHREGYRSDFLMAMGCCLGHCAKGETLTHYATQRIGSVTDYRPELTVGLRSVSGGNVVVNCRSGADEIKRQLLYLANSYIRPRGDSEAFEKQTFNIKVNGLHDFSRKSARLQAYA